jgi:hypothetical protein
MDLNNEIEVNEMVVTDPILVEKRDCVPGKLCEPKDFFEMINECALCGKLS